MPTKSRVLIGPRVPGNTKVTYANGTVQTLSDSTGVQDRKYETTTSTNSGHPPPYLTPHFFSSIKRESIPAEVNGNYVIGSTNYSLTRVSSTSCDGWPDTSVASGMPSMNELALRAIANMNPNTPKVDLPLFLFELKDLPRMLYQLGDVLARRLPPGGAPGAVLAYQFGWRPLLSDLASLVSLAEQTASRQEYLRQLVGGHHVRRKLGSGTGSTVWFLQSWPTITGITAQHHGVTKWKSWYTAEASATVTIPQMNDLRTLAFKAVLGLNGLSLSTAWNALPWSWLIDYFTTLGDFLAANRGEIPFKFKNLCVMRRTELDIDVTCAANLRGLSFTPGLLRYEEKRREVYQTTPMFGFSHQILSAGQVLNLSALALARDKRVRDLASSW